MSEHDNAPIIWKPDPDLVQDTHARRLMDKVGAGDFDALHAWSVEDIGRFWDTVNEDLGLSWFEPYTQTYDDARGLPWTRWFVGGKTNIVLNCLERHVTAGHGDREALVGEADDGTVTRYTYAELRDAVGRAAGLLRELGITPGDRVGIYMPMVPEVVIALFACFQVGAVAVPVFSAFGSDGLAVRLEDAEAKVLFTADGGYRRGKTSPIKPAADEALASVPSVENVIVLRRTGDTLTFKLNRDHWWHERIDAREPDYEIEVLDAEAPSMILYTSGTTGKPKGTVHTHAGCLAMMNKELAYAFDVKPDSRFFWLTDIGWMMGPWEMIGVTSLGGTLLVYEGAPNWPNPDRLFEMVERHRLTHLAVAPTAVRLLRRAGDDLARQHDLSTLKYLGSTGEPWDDESWLWYFEHVGQKRCPIINISGGTEIVGCLLSPLPITALKPCTLRGPGLGMDVDVFDEDGHPIREGLGHLVLKQPGPSLTKSFLGDDQRYLDTYFARFGEGVWYHGDWAYVDADGFWFLHGRSDDTVNVAGKRVGPAEVEAAIVAHSDASEAAAIGVPDELKGEDVVVFVVLKPGVEETEALREELRSSVVGQLGKTLKPREVRFVDALPKTRSAKIVRGAIKRRWLGEPVGDLASVENPEAVDAIAASR
ncbi:MAG: AMP-binding protein [Planctomycetota bacterium]|nr:AMP-binding protein [Planctomycetota bacterium]